MRPSTSETAEVSASEIAAAVPASGIPAATVAAVAVETAGVGTAAVPAAAVGAGVLPGRKPVGKAVAVTTFEALCAVINTVHPGEQRIEQQHRSQTPRARHQSRFPPRLRIPARRHWTSGDATAGVVVRRALRRCRGRLDFAALEVDSAVLGHSARR